MKKAARKVGGLLTAIKAFVKKGKPGQTIQQNPKAQTQEIKLKKEQQPKKEQPKEQPKMPSIPALNTDERRTSPPAYRKRKYDPVPAGASCGNEHDLPEDPLCPCYWTLGAVMCDLAGNRYGLTNKHNRAGVPVDGVVMQPSMQVSDASVGRRAVGKWLDIAIETVTENDGKDRIMDVAIFKFDNKAHATGQVLGKNGALLKVSGHVTNNEIKQWPTDGSKILYASSRMCGWCGVPFLGYDDVHRIEWHGKGMIINPLGSDLLTVVGSEGPNLGTQGNSGSGIYEEQSDGTVKLVAIFNGNPVVPTIEDITTHIANKLVVAPCTD